MRNIKICTLLLGGFLLCASACGGGGASLSPDSSPSPGGQKVNCEVAGVEFGVSEISDAIVVVVSEETGIISVTVDGKIKRRITPDALSALLKSYLVSETEEKKDILKTIFKDRNPLLKKNKKSKKNQ